MHRWSNQLTFILLLSFISSGSPPQSAFCCGESEVGQVPQSVRERWRLSDFYQKYTDHQGLPIVSSEKVSEEALLEAKHLVRSMLKGRDDIAKQLAEARIRVAIMAPDEQTVDIPEHSDLKPADYWNRRARGLGATQARPAISAGEENLLHLVKDRYPTENILIHEFAHTIHQFGLSKIDSNFQSKLEAAFEHAKTKGLWAKTYAMSNVDEYWAEGVQSYFDANRANDDQHNDIDTREELASYDPELFQLIDQSFQKNAWRYEGRVRTLTEEAGDNAENLVQTWRALQPARRIGLKFLLENMPESDLRSLSKDFLLEHIDGAYEAWETAAWREQIPEEVFLNGILPYANVSERRDAWRKDFRDRFASVVQGIGSPGEAGAKLNQTVFSTLDVRYSTQRKKADQSPYESMESHMASCTGLSILLIDACRSVGVPARFVGTPLWSDRSGNHSWVEIWSDGDWHFTGACEPAGNRLDEGWFIARASEAKEAEPRHAIYAVSFRKTPLVFPMVWRRGSPGDAVYAVNVTSRYANKRKPLEEGQLRVRFRAIDSRSRTRVALPIVVTSSTGEVLLDAKTRDEGFDSNDHLEAIVKKGETLRVLLDGKPTEVKAIESNQLFTIEK